MQGAQQSFYMCVIQVLRRKLFEIHIALILINGYMHIYIYINIKKKNKGHSLIINYDCIIKSLFPKILNISCLTGN